MVRNADSEMFPLVPQKQDPIAVSANRKEKRWGAFLTSLGAFLTSLGRALYAFYEHS